MSEQKMLDRPNREKIAESLMKGLGKMLGMPSVPEWDSMEDYLKEPYRVFADQILALIEPRIEEAKREEGERIRQLVMDKCNEAYPNAYKDAIIEIWQALREEK